MPGSFVRLLQQAAPDVDEQVFNEHQLQRSLEILKRLPVVGPLGPPQVADVREKSEHERARSVQSASLGAWDLLEKIGQGGMGVVYHARHRRLGQVRALKVLPPSFGRSAERLARFENEIRALGQLDHHHIVRAFGAEELDGQLVLIMELVDGQDLASLVRERGPFSIEQATDVIRQAALGLQHIHEAGLVHRDLKPRNLIQDSRGQIRILDMGLAKFRASQPETPTVELFTTRERTDEWTHTGQVMGTLGYMSPEQAGSPADVDIRADIYSLGATYYFLLTGQAPFADLPATSVRAKLEQLQANIPTAIAQLRSDVPPNVCSIVARMLQKNPANRFQTPAEVGTALEALSFRQTSHSNVQAQRRPLRWPAAAIPAAVVMMVIFSLVAGQKNWPLRRENGMEATLGAAHSVDIRQTPVAFVSQYAAAEFLIEIGGTVSVSSGFGDVAEDVASVERLPTSPFELLGIVAPDEISPRDLQRIADAAPWLNTVHLPFQKKLTREHLRAVSGRPYLGDLLLGSLEPSEVTDADLAELISTLPTLKAFWLHGLAVDGSCLESVVDPEALFSVKIGTMFPIPMDGRRPQLSAEWIRSLKKFRNLKTLSLPGIRLTPEHARAMQELTSLNYIVLTDAEGIPECISEIAAVPGLEMLDINSQEVTDAVLPKLSSCRNLKLLELYHAPVSVSAIGAFQRALPECRVLTGNRVFEPVAIATERQTADFVLRTGGRVFVTTDGGHSSTLISSVADLPGDTFHLMSVEPNDQIAPGELKSVVNASPWLNTVRIPFHHRLLPEHLEALQGCRHLGDLVLGSVSESAI
ncbi:MAG: serine/threonine protein kinase, partial [Planctomycetaceae bacterium]|nr:serine/threonine protein kinase [Planctomycetaceae bacterium]